MRSSITILGRNADVLPMNSVRKIMKKCYKEISVGSSSYKRYSGYGLKRLQEAIEGGKIDPEEA